MAAPARRPRPDGAPIWYQKHMWHHMAGPIGYDDFAGFTHAFLIREPERMIASYLRKREAAAFEDFGLERQAEFFDREADRLGHAPPVIDANDVLRDPPRRAVEALCARARHRLGPGDAAPGRRGGATTDGPWAPHWYGAVEASTGFGPPDDEPVLTCPTMRAASPSGCRPLYEHLAEHRLGRLSARLTLCRSPAIGPPVRGAAILRILTGKS